MQQITLVQYEKPDRTSPFIKDKSYNCYAAGKRVYFKNRKKLLAWLAEVNRHLNLQAHTLNRLTAETYTEYRYYFFHMKTTEQAAVEADLQVIGKLFNMLMTRSSNAGGNGYTYMRMEKICMFLLNIISNLESNDMNRLATIQRYRLKGLRKAVENVESELKWLPPEKDFEKFENT